MFDINNYIEDNLKMYENKGNYYITYNNIKIQFYLKKSLAITKISEYRGKINILVKIEDEYKDFFKKLENLFLKKFNIEKNNLISLIKENEKGSIIKLKINKRNKKMILDVYKNEEPVSYEDIEKFDKVRCLIEIDRIWNYNDKNGFLIIVKKINIE
tara:strand:+ start:412 stop:882 length:471 start_codon:yes stop_codon:yes gene_type:complete